MFFFPLVAAASTVFKLMGPHKKIVFEETIGNDDQQWIIEVSNLKKDTALRYKLTTPKEEAHKKQESDEEESSEPYYDSEANTSLGVQLKESLNKKFITKGMYRLELFNTSSRDLELSIHSDLMKNIADVNKDIRELRNVTAQAQQSMNRLANENYYLRSNQAQHIRVAESLNFLLNWLLCAPVLVVLISYGKYLLARQIVKPKGKRWKGLF
ncbi:hypothetical protein ENBRE01_2460 [Enteropsectra breve]|nr:hypothetical protein ENBRE01_2225 [Enteropsectra breve]KAI5151886.1 hypothetical protein ENBRE01_2460 [Enteropsectra breve]